MNTYLKTIIFEMHLMLCNNKIRRLHVHYNNNKLEFKKCKNEFYEYQQMETFKSEPYFKKQ